MRKLLRFLKPYTKEAILGPLFKLLEASFELLVPLVVARIVDVGIAQGDTGMIVKNCLILVALGIIGLVCAVTAQYFAARAAVGFASQVRHSLFSHIGKLSYSDLDRVGTSTMITRMTSDVGQVQSGINLTLRLVLRSPFVVLGAMVMAYVVDPECSIIFAVTIPVLSVAVFGIMLLCLPLYKKVQERLDNITGTTRENLTGVRVIRAFCKEQDEMDTFRERNDLLTATQNRVGRLSSLLNPLSYALVNLAIVVLVYAGALQVNGGNLLQGEVIALYNYMSQILVELIKLASLIITLTKAVACGRRVQAMLEVRPTMQMPENGQNPPPSDEVVRFDHVSMAYANAADVVLRDVSFVARRGEVIGVIGGTGSGKTTLVNLIPRFYDASEGQVYVQGTPVTEWSAERLRERIGVVPQKAVLFRGTIRDNLLWGNENATEEQMFEALRIAQAEQVVLDKEGGLDAPVEQNGRNFSGGQRQRLTIARALVRKPEILILDDSSSALDYATDSALRQALRRMEDAPTVFIVSQRATSLTHADRIIVLDNGEVAGIGRHDELLSNCETYREIYESQFRKESV
ncbi:MAG: ABC transporter ATP-binding protein [Ruminococcaceae bacterium]|nr:ABC transporter ATP-binding protein [Oscillospiraceae bacterium]